MSANLPHYAPDNYDALRRAVAVSQWEIGDGSWAYMILDAYFDPNNADAEEAIAELADQERAS